MIGDAFSGGLYLERDNTLIIRALTGFTVTRVEPAPDDTRDGPAWYGQRSFRGGPGSVLKKNFPCSSRPFWWPGWLS
jgi:hypothetical protein